jgi:hypothetical protein
MTTHLPGRIILLSLAFHATLVLGADLQPELPGPEGERAFQDLAGHYETPNKIPLFAKALDELADGGKRAAAAKYLLALFGQSFVDESNGRAEWGRTPYWGGGSVSPAREFRKQLAEEFGKRGGGEAALEIVRWLVEVERLPEGQTAAAQALRRIEAPGVEKLLAELLAQPHPNAALTLTAIEEAGRRNFTGLAPRIGELRSHYRGGVRGAAIKAAEKLGVAAPVPKEAFAEAFSPWLLDQLSMIRRMVLEPVPRDAEWLVFQYTQPGSMVNGEPYTETVHGWLLGEDDNNLRVLTWFAETRELPKAFTKREAMKLGDAAKKILALKGDPENARETLSRRGGLTGQFEPGFINVPTALVAAWCEERGDRASAAELLFPAMNAMEDDRWLTWAVRDQLGQIAHERMLQAFSHERDYERAIRMAEHLAQSIFDGYGYQPRAKELAAQLRRRGDDFKTFRLPEPQDWAAQRQTLSREEQIRFLLARLRLLNCIQSGQPGGVDYEDQQYATPLSILHAEDKHRVINPFVELKKMRLEIAELQLVVPALLDDDYLPTYSYWRDFHPSRTLHRVNWVVAELINDAAKRDLADVKTIEKLDAAGRKARVEEILAWCRANAGKTRAELLMQTLVATKSWREFVTAAEEALRAKLPGAGSVLIERLPDFPQSRGEIAEMVYRSGIRAAVEPARDWIKVDDEILRLWSALILFRDGNRAKNEGFAELKRLFDSARSSDVLLPAIEPLLARNDGPAVALACAILKKEDFGRGFDSDPALHHLVFTGRPEVLDYILKSLDDSGQYGSTSGEWKGKQVTRQLTRGDQMARLLAEMTTDKRAFESVAPDDERARERAALRQWITDQFARIRAGQASAFKAAPPIRPSRWQIDAP